MQQFETAYYDGPFEIADSIFFSSSQHLWGVARWYTRVSGIMKENKR